MLNLLERAALIAAIATALEVGLLCVYGTGPALTEEERAAIRDQISIGRAKGGVPAAIARDQEWDEFLKRMRRTRRETEPESKQGEPGRERESGKERYGRGPVAEEEDPQAAEWLADSGELWEHRRIPRAVRDAEVPDLRSATGVLRQATSRLVDLEDGSPAIQITSIQPGFLIEKVGFRPGDILLSINGERVATAQDGLRLWRELRNETRLIVVILRGREQVTLTYSLE